MSATTSSFSIPRPFVTVSKRHWKPLRRSEELRLSSVRRRATSETATPTEAEMDPPTEQSDDVVGIVFTPSVVNKPWLRATAVLGTLLAASYYFQQPLPGQFMKLTHVFAFASWFGSSVWVLLLSPKIMFSTLGRLTFGKLQAKLFPQFFGFSALAIVVLMGTSPFSGWPHTLTAALLTTLANALILEPIISKSAAKRYELEKADKRNEDRIQSLVKRSSRFHAYSSCAALVTVCCAVAHGFLLGSIMSF